MDQRLCVQCDGGGDEGLILLCDACDQPWHATCVGFKGACSAIRGGGRLRVGDGCCLCCSLL
eukprot:2979823-Prymnesium_polylepis.1